MLKIKVLFLAVALMFSAVPFAFADEAVVAGQEVTVNINTAQIEDLAVLKGVGESKAKAIITWREENGPFESVEQLLEVKGIGEATLALNRHRITLK